MTFLDPASNPRSKPQRLCATLQMFTGNYSDSTEKSECRDFKFMGISCIPAIPVILKSPHSDFNVKIAGNCWYRDSMGIPLINSKEIMY